MNAYRKTGELGGKDVLGLGLSPTLPVSPPPECKDVPHALRTLICLALRPVVR